jgi:hypothetical protein
LRQAKADNQSVPVPVYFGPNPVIQIRVNGAIVPFDQVLICDISDVSATDWRRPPTAKSYVPSGGGAAVNEPIAVAADPVRGRIAFPGGVSPSSVEVSYTYGFSGDLGAGPYDRSDWLTDPNNGPKPFNNPERWQVAVSKELGALPDLIFPTFNAAVQAWNNQPAGTDGVIAILDSRTYREDLTGSNSINVPAGSRLVIVAADWPALREHAPPQSKDLDPHGLRPHFLGAITATGTAAASSPDPGALFIDGLLIEGRLTIGNGNLGTLGLSHATVTPGGGLNVLSSAAPGGANDGLTVSLYRAICGPVSLGQNVPELDTVDCVVTSGPASAANAPAISAPNSIAAIQTTTVFGTTTGNIINASNSLFTGIVTAQRKQTGCVRFCYVPSGSQTAKRYKCQPDLALANVPAAGQSAVIARLTPQFTSIAFGQPGYAQLSLRCPSEIATGADDGSEMGVFSFLQQPQRITNLLTAFDEYLRFGLEAGIIEET